MGHWKVFFLKCYQLCFCHLWAFCLCFFYVLFLLFIEPWYIKMSGNNLSFSLINEVHFDSIIQVDRIFKKLRNFSFNFKSFKNIIQQTSSKPCQVLSLSSKILRRVCVVKLILDVVIKITVRDSFIVNGSYKDGVRLNIIISQNIFFIMFVSYFHVLSRCSFSCNSFTKLFTITFSRVLRIMFCLWLYRLETCQRKVSENFFDKLRSN